MLTGYTKIPDIALPDGSLSVESSKSSIASLEKPRWNGSIKSAKPSASPRKPLSKTLSLSQPALDPGPAPLPPIATPVADECSWPQSALVGGPDGVKCDLSPFQQELLSTILPRDETNSSEQLDHVIHKHWTVHRPVHRDGVEKAVNAIVVEYPILSSRFYRNPKILDADVECLQSCHVDAGTLLDFYDLSDSTRSLESLLLEFRSTVNLCRPFRILCLKSGAESHQIHLAASSVLLDVNSLVWIHKKIQTLMAGSVAGLSEHCKGYSCEEIESYSAFIQHTPAVSEDWNFWRSQCFQTRLDSIKGHEREKLEQKVKLLQTETARLARLVGPAAMKKTEYQSRLEKLVQQRQNLEGSSSHMESLVDPFSGNTLMLPATAKQQLLQTVFLPFDTSLGVAGFLAYHEISATTSQKLGASTESIEWLASLSDQDVVNLDLTRGETVQLVALVDFVKNKIKEAIDDQEKLKFTLERDIVKTKRGLVAFVE
ncbi:hypothetical protein HDU91_002271, partial [Kappamyces sp. JEL0680]